MALQISMTQHPISPAHKIVKVTLRGRMYAVVSAAPFPTVEDVQRLWHERRQMFERFDERTGRYAGRA
jgi:hypothetical protein